MITKDEALKMAIEALEEAKEQLGGLPALDKLIQDCKEALEHSNQWISVDDRLPDYGVDVIAMETDGRVYRLSRFDYLRKLGLRAQPTHSNDFKVRREGAAAPMQRLIDGKPGLIVDRTCKMLRKSLAGGYHFKRVSVGAGQERFRDAPNKNEHSHVGDAFGEHNQYFWDASKYYYTKVIFWMPFTPPIDQAKE